MKYIIVASWGLAVIGVWLWTTSYGFSTYQPATEFACEQWPADTKLTLAPDRPTLVLFLHPRCPCSRASIRELERLLTGPGLSDQQRPKLTVVATIPTDAGFHWRHTDTTALVSLLPNATLEWDVEGVEASHFGAVTSGTVMLYTPQGLRLFAGGVTASRSHEGDNVGAERVREALLQPDPVSQASIPAFGCRLCVTGKRIRSHDLAAEESLRDTDSGRGGAP